MKSRKKQKTKTNKKTSISKTVSKNPKKPSTHKGNKKFKAIIAMSATILVILGVLAVMFVPNIIKEQQRKDAIVNTRNNLESCLSETQNLQYGTSEYYDAKIQCYEKNDVDESSKKIQELTESKKSADLNSCVKKVHDDYAVTEDEVNNAYASGITALNIISDRIISGYNAEIICYETYTTSNANSKISELETKKTKLQAAITAANVYDYAGSGDYSSSTYSTTEIYNYPSYTPPSVNEQSQDYSCEDYYSIYYSEYVSVTSQIQSSYNSAITDAHNNQCSSFGGCPAASKLERQRDYELRQEKSNFQYKLTSVGCGDFYNL